MTTVRELLEGAAVAPTADLNVLAGAIEALNEAERTSTACAAAMALGEGMGGAVNADLDFVDLCQTTERILSRSAVDDVDMLQALLTATIRAAEHSHDQCSRHADHHAHCRMCADSSQRVMQACRTLAAGLTR